MIQFGRWQRSISIFSFQIEYHLDADSEELKKNANFRLTHQFWRLCNSSYVLLNKANNEKWLDEIEEAIEPIVQKRLADWHFALDSGQQKNIAAKWLHKMILWPTCDLQIEQKPSE